MDHEKESAITKAISVVVLGAGFPAGLFTLIGAIIFVAGALSRISACRLKLGAAMLCLGIGWNYAGEDEWWKRIFGSIAFFIAALLLGYSFLAVCL